MSLNTVHDSFFVTHLECQQNDVDFIFFPSSPEKLSYFRCKLFCNKNIFQIICLNFEFASYLSTGAYFFGKTLALNKLKSKKVSS